MQAVELRILTRNSCLNCWKTTHLMVEIPMIFSLKISHELLGKLPIYWVEISRYLTINSHLNCQENYSSKGENSQHSLQESLLSIIWNSSNLMRIISEILNKKFLFEFSYSMKNDELKYDTYRYNLILNKNCSFDG